MEAEWERVLDRWPGSRKVLKGGGWSDLTWWEVGSWVVNTFLG